MSNKRIIDVPTGSISGSALTYSGDPNNNGLMSSVTFNQIKAFCSGSGGGITSITTSGSSGPATVTGSILNIPIYSGSGGSGGTGSFAVDGTTLTATSNTASINLGHANTWTVGQTFNLGVTSYNLVINSTSGYFGGSTTKVYPDYITGNTLFLGANLASPGSVMVNNTNTSPTNFEAGVLSFSQVGNVLVLDNITGSAGGSNRPIAIAPRGNINNVMIGSSTDNGSKFQVTGNTTHSGSVSIAPGTTTTAQLHFSSGSAPTSPQTGDMWFDATGSLKLFVNGVVKGVVLS
jgi:hypothetical protein